MFGGWNPGHSLSRTWWWGERGLVAALFQDLGAGESLDRWRAFLDMITFAGQAPSWGVLRHADVVVEPSFGSSGFGRPDAVALLEFDAQERVAIFFEAKLGAYAEAATLPLGRSLEGFNSSINGQLELNHRLAVALELARRASRGAVDPEHAIQRDETPCGQGPSCPRRSACSHRTPNARALPACHPDDGLRQSV